ncbi:VOC family protein [Paenibacillus sp. Soil522]|uniref:VOC family protein n=1 Tax=Paenibacillus sp. Soil522 TaxID=1736388 RepID=UPI0006FDC644|nr:VOC family protein [Paenibacillus sp. Soil522]KRE31595.1 3-demethylubiquinone-9 3-methyltransferase [Paenibacillus sp. Soil522]
MSTSLIPFLEMNGSANEAIDFYEKALDAKVVYMLRFGDVPGNPESPLPPEKKNMVGYAVLKIGESEFQLTDHFTGSSYQKGTQVTIVVQTNDKDKATQYFEALKQGGQVNEPLQASFFSPAYGNVTDKFGVTFRILTKGRQ